MTGKILIAGVGNIFLGDDAFGVEVVQRLARRTLPKNVQLVDFGIRSYDLAYALMEDWELVIMVDAVPAGESPGTVYIIEPDLPAFGDTAPSPDAHTMNPVSVLQLVGALGGTPSRMLVVGCEPENVEPDETGQIEVSPPVARAVDEAVRIIEELISQNKQATAA
jgi:hydrogenase maturation protease